MAYLNSDQYQKGRKVVFWFYIDNIYHLIFYIIIQFK